jgi:hypothetical protein
MNFKGIPSFLIVIISVMMMSQTAQAAVKINYQLSFPEAQAHYVEVEMSIRNLDQTYTDV